MRFEDNVIEHYYMLKHKKQIRMKDIADACDISVPSVSNFFRNSNSVSVKTGEKIMDYIDNAPIVITFQVKAK